MTDKTIDLDQHRGIAARKATDLRRLLADRALVLHNGTITLDTPVDLDRPRDRGHPGFIALRSRLLHELGVAEPRGPAGRR